MTDSSKNTGRHFAEPAPRTRTGGQAPVVHGDAHAEEETALKDTRATEARAEKSSNMVSALIIVSRITGFMRTFMQAWAIGATMLASCYTIADQLPNVLYELVMGGMLITSFLPVYIKVKGERGSQAASDYASNLLSFVMFAMIILAVLGFVFAAPVVWTQSAGATESFDFDLTVWLFRCFSVEIVLYALSSIFSGVLNAERDYLWSNIAPILNNFVIITAFLLFGLATQNGILDTRQAIIILAIGNPLGVAMQVLVQVPALRRHGIRLRPRINFHDPYLRNTLSIGLPTLVVTLVAYPTNAVMSSCNLSVTEIGPAVAYYARVWYVLPFSVFAIPLSTTMFTELSSYVTQGKMKAFVTSFTSGMRKILFTLIPFVLFFAAFSPCLIAVIASGSFTTESISLTAGYLAVLALTLPWYGLSSYLQKACSSLLSMKFYMVATCFAAVVQIVVCLVFTPLYGIYVVPFSSMLYYGVIDIGVLIQLRGRLGRLGLKSVAASVLRALAFGTAGSLAGWLIVQGVTAAFGPCVGLVRGLLYAMAGGFPALAVTFGGATLLGMSDAPFFDSIFRRLIPARLLRARR